jgi:hypothetical protein
MIGEQIFERYLEYRVQRAGALTPGQKLEVVNELMGEARQGTVPAGENSVARVPLDSPSVQAVIRGEPISIGNTVVRRKTGVENWSTSQKLGILGAMVLVILFGTGLLVWASSAKAAPAATPTLEPSATLFPTDTATPTPSPTITLTPVPTPTITPVPALLMGAGSPSDEANAPASLEIQSRLFVLQQGKVEDKTGTWNPQGPEWLAGTEVRRVIALPLAQVQDLPVQPGDDVTLRTRNGRVVVYPVTQVVRLTPNQIEAFMSLSPSIIVTLFDSSQANAPDRLVIIGELNSPPDATATPVVERAVVNKGANLRVKPSTKGLVIAGLPQGTYVDVPYPLRMVSAEGFNWVFVQSPFGNGWVVRYFLSFNQ